MKRLICTFLALCMLLSAASALAATAFDSYCTYATTHTVANPYFPETRTAGEIMADVDGASLFVATTWYSLLHYETTVLNTPINDTMAANIYRGSKNGPGVICLTATSADSPIINIICGNAKGQAHWMEVNAQNGSMRAFEMPYGVGRYATDEEFLSDYTLNSYLYPSLGSTIYGGAVPAEALSMAYGAQTSTLYNFFDALYERIHGALPSIQ